jgi:hypothetical protein
MSHAALSAPSHILLKNRRQCVRIESHLKWPSGREDFIAYTTLEVKTLNFKVPKYATVRVEKWHRAQF